MGNANCQLKRTGLYECTFEKLIRGDRSILEFSLRDAEGKTIEDPEQLNSFLRLIKGEDAGVVRVVGDDEQGKLARARSAPDAYTLVHELAKSSSKQRILVEDLNTKTIKFGKRISFRALSSDERADSALRTVARILDIPFHRNVAHPESLFWDDETLTLTTVSEKAESTLGDLGEFIAGRPERGAQLVYFALQLLLGLQHVHQSGNVLGDVSSQNILLYRLAGIPELRVAPGKRTLPVVRMEKVAGLMPLTLSAQAEGTGITAMDVDVVSCAYIEPGSAGPSSTGTVTKAGDVWSAGSSLFEALTGVPYGCGCALPDYAERLARLELVPEQAEPSTFWRYFQEEILAPLSKPMPADVFHNMGIFAAPFLSLVRQMLVLNPQKRKSVDELLKHPVFLMPPHHLSGFQSFIEMEQFVSKFKKMPAEARLKLLLEGAEQTAARGAGITVLSLPLKTLRERLVSVLMKEFEKNYPSLEPQLRKALDEAIRMTDKILEADTQYGEYARLMLANWDLSLNLGTNIEFPKRKSLLEKTLARCAEEFQLDLSPDIIAKAKASILAKHKAGFFVENKAAREAEPLSADELVDLVGQTLSTQVYAEGQKLMKGRRVYIGEGSYAGKYGTVERVSRQNKQNKLLVLLDSGEKVIVDEDKVYKQ